ncbi:MAG TPA: TetR family transcriptional regulator C-terminal domain-containing protein, partial [Polyangiaceae bacterium]|nr:TetR family transcriptional regulator C-terminal domain-containing protein [Polyangiaceae bacterium]
LKPYLIDVLDASGSARANLERVFDQWEATALAPEFHGCLVGNAVSDLRAKDAAMADFLRRKMTLMEEALFRALRRAKRDGEVSATLDARGAARSLLVLSQGLAIVARVHPEPAYVRSVIAQARRLLGDPSAPS